MLIRPVESNQDIIKAYEIETSVFSKEAAAALEAFQMRKQLFGAYFLVAENELDHQIIGVTNSIKLHDKELADDSIKQVTQHAEDGQYLCILTIAVHPSYQRRGVATKLLQRIIEIARKDGLNGIVLMCEEHLISFYEKHGFLYVAPSASQHAGIKWHEMNLLWK
ncbi:GNAT family N-acetyltransferase [Paenibacillus alginolyticus]|uniref:GNAT family N-acetyltransferase n=1 Tax=Paenibacillus alginolyticus TaxID=59839 RepID=A0ABT4GBF0_9BACL|nr:GNAT family N-acetyltransferase [Paenibacillus alginolyticus]MCY9664115.1 GNAT family N-acetyltransferase [Paenibacillus alginolyticus]MCY9693517.1 GNAT family N-acetyltransferase [Paenibacillus alginolyticus]MEC0144450.1 GNAT family N-acetyltransferase [Paenibacillus alginolyticus]